MALTDKDLKLLALLKVNAREPVASLARKLGVSRTTVQDRLKRLEQQGVIAGYSVKIADDVSSGGIQALVELTAEPRKQADIMRQLLACAEVEQLHTVSGKFDFVVFVRTESTQKMDKFLDHVGLIPGVTRTESAVILSTKLDRR